MSPKLPYSPQLDWYLNDAPTLLGVRSAHGALVSAIERGGPSNYVSDEPYHAQAIGAVGSVKLARDLEAAWRRLGPSTRALLRAHYERRRYFELGVEAHLGTLAKAALHLAAEEYVEVETSGRVLDYVFDPLHGDDEMRVIDGSITRRVSMRLYLLEACTSSTIPASKTLIETYRTRAQEALEDAHRAWDSARKEQAKAWAKARQSTVEAGNDPR